MVVYVEHLDAMLAALCGEKGPFRGCVDGQHNDTGTPYHSGRTTPTRPTPLRGWQMEPLVVAIRQTANTRHAGDMRCSDPVMPVTSP